VATVSLRYNQGSDMLTAHNNNLVSSATAGEGSRAEFQALASSCGVFDLNFRAKIKLAGEDRVRWLNGMVTNNVRDLAVGHGIYAFLLNPQGHILGDLYAYNRGDSLLVDTDKSQAARMLEIFDRYIIMDDVVVEDVSDKLTAIGIAGPRAQEVLRAAGIEPVGLQPLELRPVTGQQSELILVRGESELRESYEIWLSPENAGKVQGELVLGGAGAVGNAALDLYRIALGTPRYGQDIRERDLPQETEQARALNFSKGCYVGQEIVERIRSRGAVHRKFTGFLIEGPLPAAGTKIQVDGKDVGEITSAASLPFESGDRSVALGYIRREVGVPGKKVVVGASTVEVAELPFRPGIG
jgi:folate-binding protein YgfZ